MTITASWNGQTIAKSENTIVVENNHYFPPEDVNADLLEPSQTTSHCPWKGDASYHNVVVGGQRNSDAAWFYPDSKAKAANIKGYIAFWKGVEVSAT